MKPPVWLSKIPRAWLLTLTVVVLFFLTFRVNSLPIYSDLDSSYRFGFNYFFANGVPIGKDIIFTYGPLGFLMFPQPVGHNLLIGLAVQVLLLLLLLVMAVAFMYRVKADAGPIDIAVGLAAVFLLANFIESGSVNYTGLGVLLTVLLAVFLLWHQETAQPVFAVLGTATCVAAMLVKSTYGVAGLCILLSYSVLRSVTERSAKPLALLLLGTPALFVAAWLLLYRSPEGILTYLRGTLELAAGFGSAMALTTDPDNSWWLIIGSLGLMAWLPFYMGYRRVFFLYGLFLLTFAAMFKYSFSREDSDHVWVFVDLLVCFDLLVLIVAGRIKRYVVPVMAASVALLLINLHYVGIKLIEHKLFFGRLFVPQVMTVNDGWNSGYLTYSLATGGYADYEATLLWQSGEFIKENRLPPEIRRTIGTHSVDTYPWETSYVPANDLRWSPRPVFQSYTAYTPWLDQQNAAYFASARAPTFLVWERDHWGGELGSIDDRYLLNDEPLAIMSLLSRYKLIALSPRVALFERSERASIRAPRTIQEERGLWNRWIDVPRSANGILRVNIGFSRRLIGIVKRLAYKEGDIFIDYRFRDNEIRRYRLVVDNMSSGVWVNPFLTTLSPTFEGAEVAQIRLSHAPGEFLDPELRFQWVFYPFAHSPH